jgi:hypothetical protein
MNIEILDQDYNLIAIVDEYESFIWTDRYNQPGDFEIFSPITSDNLQCFVRDNYIKTTASEHMMIIEDIVYSSSAESGRTIKVIGRSLESILDRRIVWGVYDVDGNLQDEVERMFNDCIINPSDPDRKISNFRFERSTDPAITGLTITNQYTGNTLLDIIQTITDEFDIGWKIVLNDQKQMVFSFYVGTDRSYAQTDVPYVVFSPAYDNIIESTYTVAGATLKNVILVAGEDNSYSVEGENLTLGERPKIYRTVGGGTGLLRREIYANQVGIEQEEGSTQEDYEAKLDQFGQEELQKYTVAKKFDGQYETKLGFRYGTDFFIGDTVEVADEFGNEASSKVIEFIWSSNTSDGEEAYPTFRSTETNE